jgi:hypothetical protein
MSQPFYQNITADFICIKPIEILSSGIVLCTENLTFGDQSQLHFVLLPILKKTPQLEADVFTERNCRHIMKAS